MEGPSENTPSGTGWYYTGTLGRFEWISSQEGPNRTFYVVPTANIGGVFGPKVFYEGQSPDYIYRLRTNGPVSGNDVAAFMASCQMTTMGATASITDARGNSFTGVIWGVPRVTRPNIKVPVYEIECWFKNPSGSINY
jgi:hypothetical protein